MNKKGILIILLCVFVIADVGVFISLAKEFRKSEATSVSTSSGDDSVADYTTEGYPDEEDYDSEYSDENVEENPVFSAGDVIDLIDSEIVPCIYGDTDDIYEKCSIDDYEDYDDVSEDYYNKSNYGNNYKHIMTCVSEEHVDDVSFALKKNYSKLSFALGLWDCDDDTSQVVIFKGYGKNKKEIFNEMLEPGDEEKEYTVDVSDCDVISIRLVAPEGGLTSYLVTDGFKLTYK